MLLHEAELGFVVHYEFVIVGREFSVKLNNNTNTYGITDLFCIITESFLITKEEKKRRGNIHLGFLPTRPINKNLVKTQRH
jgi:hypothetical protein